MALAPGLLSFLSLLHSPHVLEHRPDVDEASLDWLPSSVRKALVLEGEIRQAVPPAGE